MIKNWRVVFVLVHCYNIDYSYTKQLSSQVHSKISTQVFIIYLSFCWNFLYFILRHFFTHFRHIHSCWSKHLYGILKKNLCQIILAFFVIWGLAMIDCLLCSAWDLPGWQYWNHHMSCSFLWPCTQVPSTHIPVAIKAQASHSAREGGLLTIAGWG